MPAQPHLDDDEFLNVPTDPSAIDPASNALLILLQGNRRFLTGRPIHHHDVVAARRWATAQHPFGMVISCVDSRVPVEAVFDQDFGSLLVARSAGHVLDQALRASVEFGVVDLKVPLLMVLGHDRCGAITAVVDAVRQGRRLEGAKAYLAEVIGPSVSVDGDDPYAATMVAHVAATVRALRELPTVRQAQERGALRVVGARYEITTGRVRLLSL